MSLWQKPQKNLSTSQQLMEMAHQKVMFSNTRLIAGVLYLWAGSRLRRPSPGRSMPLGGEPSRCPPT